MPYQTRADLPAAVKQALPEHAQDIFKEAFNHAIQEYQDPKNAAITAMPKPLHIKLRGRQ